MLRKLQTDNFSDSEEAPDEIEHGLIKDSVLEIAKADFALDEVEDLPLGNIRKAVSDVAYVGKPVSRKNFETHNWIEENDDDEAEESEADSFDDASILNESGEEKVTSEEESLIGEEDSTSKVESFNTEENTSEEESYDEDSDKFEDKSDEGGDDDDINEEKPETFEGINIFSDKVKDVETDVRKGKAIKNQLLIWEHLIESRIKFQKAVQSCNTFYQADKYPDFMSSLSDEERKVVTNAENKFKELLDILVQVDGVLLKNCGDYQKSKNNSTIANDKEDDSEDMDGPPAKRLKLGLRRRLGMDGSLRQWRDSVLETWNDRANLSAPRSARFSILEGSILRQLEHALADRTTLLARTRVRRGGEPVLGKPMKQVSEELPADSTHHRTKVQEEDPELFNDDDFYHKLLKDFIDRKTSNITDPSKLGREWTKLEKMRSKMKRTVDTRATKGRRLRYTVHQKLVNFMAPIKYWTMDEAVEADLFRSLFGQAATVALPSKNTDVAKPTPV